MKTNLRRRDYHKYPWKKAELVWAVVQSLAVTGFLAYFFYRSVWALLPLSAVGVFFFRRIEKQKIALAKEELTVQFKECILSVAASLKAGYAVENAFMESKSDMLLLYGADSVIYEELELIRRGLVLNISLEEQLLELAERSDCKEITQFAQVFAIAKRNGGNLPEIIRNSSELIGQRIAAKQEITALLGGRKMEQNIMKLMPFGILLYVGTANPGYFDVLYHNWQGEAIMTGCMVAYLAACMMGDMIMEQIAAKAGV